MEDMPPSTKRDWQNINMWNFRANVINPNLGAGTDPTEPLPPPPLSFAAAAQQLQGNAPEPAFTSLTDVAQVLQREAPSRALTPVVYRRTPTGTRMAQELHARRPPPEAPNHRYQLMADRYRRYQTGDNLHNYDVKREAFNLLTPDEQYAFFKKLPNGQHKTDLWINKLSPEQRIRFAGKDYTLVEQLLPAEQNEWAAAVTLQKTYRGNTIRKQLAAQRQTPFPDESTFYWANRSPELIRMKSQAPQQFHELYQAYESTAPSHYFAQPMLLHSMKRGEALDEAARRLGMLGLDWMRYAPANFGGHTWQKNLIWLQGGMHRQLPVWITISPDDRTIILGDTGPGVTTENRGVSAFAREILGLSGHYNVMTRPDGLQILQPRQSARHVTLEEIQTPKQMPAAELRNRFAAMGINVAGITPQGGPPAPEQNSPLHLHPGTARQFYFNTIGNAHTLLGQIDDFDARVREVFGDSDSENDQPRPPVPQNLRDGAIQQFRVLLMNYSNALATIDTCLSSFMFPEGDRHHQNSHVAVIREFQNKIAVLESIATKIYPEETAGAGPLSWVQAFIDAKAELAVELEERLNRRFAGELTPETTESSQNDSSDDPSSQDDT
jgi:hypothetical protein